MMIKYTVPYRARRNRHRLLFRVMTRWPDRIPDEDVNLPARLSDWAQLHGIEYVAVEAALEYRKHVAPELGFEQLKALAMLAGQMHADGMALGYADAECEKGE